MALLKIKVLTDDVALLNKRNLTVGQVVYQHGKDVMHLYCWDGSLLDLNTFIRVAYNEITCSDCWLVAKEATLNITL